MEGVNKFFQGVEEALRVPGYIPIVSSITGFIRILVANFLQGLLGAFIVVVGLVFGVCGQICGMKAAAQQWLKIASFGVVQVVHASLNSYRGAVEMIPIFGNIALYFYDKGMKRKQLVPYPKPIDGKKPTKRKK